MKEEKCFGFLREAEREGASTRVFMHRTEVRLSEQLIEGKPIAPDLRP